MKMKSKKEGFLKKTLSHKRAFIFDGVNGVNGDV